MKNCCFFIYVVLSSDKQNTNFIFRTYSFVLFIHVCIGMWYFLQELFNMDIFYKSGLILYISDAIYIFNSLLHILEKKFFLL